MPGKPAPEIDGVDFNGNPLKLSDYRGKVVVLSFWGSWCGPCMGEIPLERELAERLKGKPFALLGVNCDEDKTAAKKAIEIRANRWPNWNDGAPDSGPIVKRYHIQRVSNYLRHRCSRQHPAQKIPGNHLDKAVDELLGELEAK